MYNILRCLFGRWSLVRRVGKGRFSYAGPYHGGHASYVYLETPSGRVYDGPFSFSGGSMTARTLFFNSPYDDGIIKFGGRYPGAARPAGGSTSGGAGATAAVSR